MCFWREEVEDIMIMTECLWRRREKEGYVDVERRGDNERVRGGGGREKKSRLNIKWTETEMERRIPDGETVRKGGRERERMGCINNKYIEAGMEERETEERERERKEEGWISTIAGA